MANAIPAMGFDPEAPPPPQFCQRWPDEPVYDPNLNARSHEEKEYKAAPVDKQVGVENSQVLPHVYKNIKGTVVKHN